MPKAPTRDGLYRLIVGRRHAFRLAGPEGGADRLVLDDRSAPKPTGWAVVQVRRTGPNAKLTLGVTSATGVHDIQLTGGQAGRGTDLIRLPDTVSDVVLRSHARRSAGAACAGAGELPAPDDVVLREINAVEAMLRAVAAGGWRHAVARLRQVAAAARRRGIRSALADLAVCYMPVEVPSYQEWIDLYDRPNTVQLAGLRAQATALPLQPTFSVVLAIHNAAESWLSVTIASLRSQVYDRWELCIAHDRSPDTALRAVLQREAAADPRIRLCSADNTWGATASALTMASGGYVVLADPGDGLAPHALLMMAEAINAHPDADLLYSDEDSIDPDGRRYEPYFKPDFNAELLHSQNFVSHLGVYRSQLVRAVGGLRDASGGSQDHDLALRVAAATCQPVIHVPHVLYHRRRYPGSRNAPLEPLAEAAHEALRQPAAGLDETVAVVTGLGGYRRVQYPPPPTWPTVTAIVPTRDHVDVLRACIEGLLDGTDYPALDIMIVDNDSQETATRDFFDAVAGRGVTLLASPGPFNYAAMNNTAARHARGEILLLINNDVSMTDDGWLREMVTLMLRPNVGAVGARLLYADGTVQHGGVVLGMGGVAGHVQRGADSGDSGYFGQLHVVREVSCCTAACLTVWADAFAAVGGLDAANLPVAFNDVDLCMRLRAAGKRILWTPYATLTHWESRSRGSDLIPTRVAQFNAEIAYMKARWGQKLLSDPFFNANLSLDHVDPTICFPPRVPRPWGQSH